MCPKKKKDKKKPGFRYKRTERPKMCPKCGGVPEFEDNEESTDLYEITRVRCTECNFAYDEYFRYEHWEPLEEDDEEDNDE